jgi:hypothetical protein
MKSNNGFAAILVVAVLFSANTNLTVSTADSAKKLKAPCRIQIGQAHISKSVFVTNGVRAVKVNASSICNVPQSRVSLTVEIWKHGKFGNLFVASTDTRSPSITYPGNQVDNFDTWRRCKNSEKTLYFGKAFAKAFIQGKWQFASDTYSLKPQPLKCGT